MSSANPPRRDRPEVRAGVAGVDLSDRTVLITGATDGIGRHAAHSVARLGARILIHGRSRSKAERVVDTIETAGGTATYHLADFSSLEEVREFATRIRRDVDRVDVLVNNAGTYVNPAHDTGSGPGVTITVNHLAPFLLTHILLDIVPPHGRIITTASEAHRNARLSADRVAHIGSSEGFRGYARSKLANVLFTRELARRLTDRPVNCFHPGFVPGSSLYREAPIYVRTVMQVCEALPRVLTSRLFETPTTGAVPLVYLVASGAVRDTTGGYFVGTEPHSPSAAASNDELAGRLWTWSEEAVTLGPEERL